MIDYWTADYHFGHPNIIKYCKRPFRNTHEMDERLISETNKIVQPDDNLYVLGDWCVWFNRQNYFNIALDYFRRINCKNIHIVWGNHDIKNLFPKSAFKSTQDYLELKIGHQLIVCSHYAMAIWNKSHRGAIQLYGHSHSSAEPFMDSIMPERKSLDVGIDNAQKLLGAYRPFSYSEILDILKDRKGYGIDYGKR